jgi:hypothetical protein
MQTRRSILAMAGAAVTLTACGTTTITASQLATDAQLIASGLASAITAIAAISSVPAATVTQLQGYLATIKADAATVAAASAGTSVVQEIASTVQTVADIALPLIPGGSAIVSIVNAAVSLLPTILAAAGVTSAAKTSPIYSPEQARLILRGAAAK